MHAIRRYAERVLRVRGLPRDDARAMLDLEGKHEIDTVAIHAFIAAAVVRGVAAGAMTVRNGAVRYVLEGNHVVTVVAHAKHRRTGPRIARAED